MNFTTSCTATCDKCSVSLLSKTTQFIGAYCVAVCKPFDPICDSNFRFRSKPPTPYLINCSHHWQIFVHARPPAPQLFANFVHQFIKHSTHLPPRDLRTGLECQRVFTVWPRAFGHISLAGYILLKYLSS